MSDRREQTDSRIKRAYEPYIARAIAVFWKDAIFVLSFGIIIYRYPPKMLLSWESLIGTGTVCAAILFCALTLYSNYRIPLLSIVERLGNRYEKKTISVLRIREEFDLNGRGGRTIPRLYEARLGVDSWRLDCIDEKGKKLKLYSAMNGKQYQLLHDEIEVNNGVETAIIYGRWTHVIIRYIDKRESIRMLNLRNY